MWGLSWTSPFLQTLFKKQSSSCRQIYKPGVINPTSSFPLGWNDSGVKKTKRRLRKQRALKNLSQISDFCSTASRRRLCSCWCVHLVMRVNEFWRTDSSHAESWKLNTSPPFFLIHPRFLPLWWQQHFNAISLFCSCLLAAIWPSQWKFTCMAEKKKKPSTKLNTVSTTSLCFFGLNPPSHVDK